MKYLELIDYLAKKEGLKKQISIAQIKENKFELFSKLKFGESPSLLQVSSRESKLREPISLSSILNTKDEISNKVFQTRRRKKK